MSSGARRTRKSTKSAIGSKNVMIQPTEDDVRSAGRDSGLSKTFDEEADEDDPLARLQQLPLLVRDDTELYKYGWGAYTPEILQSLFRKPVTLLVVLSFVGFVNAYGVHGVLEAASTQIEQRFGMNETDAVVNIFCYYSGVILVLPVIGYFGTHSAHKARWIAVSSLFVAIACCIIVSPHAFVAAKEHEERAPPQCFPRVAKNCTSSKLNVADGNKLSKFRRIFAFGNFVYGAGTVAAYTLGIALMDEHVSHRVSAIYTGVYRAAEVAGTATGYIVTGSFLRIRGTIDKQRSFSDGLTHDDPRFYGAWWIPMLICAAMSLIGSILMFGYPFQLAGENRAVVREATEDLVEGWRVPAGTSKEWSKDVGDGAWSLLKRSTILLRQPIFIGLVVSNICTVFLLGGMGSFIVDYVETIFSIDVLTASYTVGGVILSASVLGLLAGMGVQYKFDFTIGGKLWLSLATAVGSFICLFAFLVQCNFGVVGFAVGYQNLAISNSLNHTCNSRCCCDEEFRPSCWKDGKEIRRFYSPCHAGCSEILDDNGFNCSCANQTDVSGSACTWKCQQKLVSFLIAVTWCSIFIYMRKNATEQAVLRFVPFKYRVVAICFAALMARMFGAIPGILAIGFLRAETCLLHKGETFADPSRRIHFNRKCIVYNVGKLTKEITILLTVAGAVVVGSLCMAVASYNSMQRRTSKCTTTQQEDTAECDLMMAIKLKKLKSIKPSPKPE